MTVKDIIANKIAHERFDVQLDQLALSTRRRVGIQALKCTLVTVLVFVSLAVLYRDASDIGHHMDEAYDEQYHQLDTIQHLLVRIYDGMKQQEDPSKTASSFLPKNVAHAHKDIEDIFHAGHSNDHGHHGFYEATILAVVELITKEVALTALIYLAVQESAVGVLSAAVIAFLITVPEVLIVGVDAACGVTLLIITVLCFSYALALRTPGERRSPRMSMMSTDESVV